MRDGEYVIMGRRGFLTKEEAETALAEREGKNNG